jgi:predicted  nucleic acid-binding Zn-ribbon protein
LRKTQSKVEYLGQQLSSAVRNLHEAEEEAPQYTEAMYQAKNKADAARDKLKQYQKSNGKLKGVDLWVWKSPTRKLGEEAALQAHALEAHFENAQKDYEAAQNKYERYKNEVASYSEQKAQSEDELTTLEKTLGNVSDLEQAEEIITYNVAQSLKDIDADQLKQMVQDGEISEGEYVDALTILNTPSAQLALDDYQRDDGQGY